MIWRNQEAVRAHSGMADHRQGWMGMLASVHCPLARSGFPTDKWWTDFFYIWNVFCCPLIFGSDFSNGWKWGSREHQTKANITEWVSLSQLQLTGEEPNCEAPWLGTRGVVQCPFCCAVRMSYNWKNKLEQVHIYLHTELVPKLNICIRL